MLLQLPSDPPITSPHLTGNNTVINTTNPVLTLASSFKCNTNVTRQIGRLAFCDALLSPDISNIPVDCCVGGGRDSVVQINTFNLGIEISSA